MPPSQTVAPAVSPAPTLTLQDAEARALKNHPRLMAQRLRAEASQKQIGEQRAVYFPQLTGNLTAVQSNGDTAVAAGAVTTSSVSTRAAGGLSLLQLVTDFGRTRDLVRSAKFSSQASDQRAEDVRQQILRDVDEAYYGVQAAESVRQTALAVLDFRQVSLRQLSALAESQLRSTLDVQFAQVLVSQAQMAVARADSNVLKARAQLTEAMGDSNDPNYQLTGQALPPDLENDVNIYIHEALQNRPDLKALLLDAQAAHQFSLSEKKLSYPTVNLLGSAGEVPVHDQTLHQEYGAAGVNISVPVFNGGLYRTEHQQAELRAQAADRDVSNLTLLISRDVRAAWAEANDDLLQMQVARKLVDQTNVALRLAQARYDAGLGSIVELNEAELNQSSALITAASARFDYLSARTTLNYIIGVVR